MTPVQFEARHGAEWSALEEQVRVFQERPVKRKQKEPPASREFAERYRRVCEHLSLARERSYPAQLVDRLQRVAGDAHQLIYQQGSTLSLRALRKFLRQDFPRCVHQHRHHVLAASLLFALPLVVMAALVYLRPDLILTVVDPSSAQELEQMYADDSESIGRHRDAPSDWAMFGYYIDNNIGIAFRCFAGGFFVGIGSMFFLIYNGAMIGSVAGFLTERGLAHTFYSFVATHSSFELLAIVLSGAAGLRLGQALLIPGRHTRRASLVQATRDITPLIYGFIVMLLVAAAIEAFWSSSQWIPVGVKYAVAATCWAGLLAYLIGQGRRAR